MGIFSSENEEEKQYRLLIKGIRSSNIDVEVKNILITYIEEVRDKKRNNDFFEYEFLERIVVEIVNSDYGYDFNEYFDEIKDIVRFLLPEGMNTEEYQSIKNMVVNNLIGSNGLIEKGIFDKNVYASFKSRHDYMFVANLLASIEDIPCSYQDVFDYVCEVGAWMPNQDAFRCEVVACINGLSGVVGSSQEYFTNRIEEAKKRVGVYPVDEKTLALISKEAEKAQSLIVKLDNMQRKVDRFKESIDTSVKTGKKDVADLITQGKKEIGEYSVQSVKEMQESIAAAKTEIISQLDQYLISLENTLKQSSDKVFNQILLDTQEKIRQIRVAAQGLTSATSSELLRIQQASQDSVDKLRNYVENEPALQELLKGVELDEGLKSAILQFSSLSTGAMSGAVVAPTKAGILIPGNDRLVVPANPNVVIPENSENIGILPAFDESIPFDVRIEKILTEKRRREENGEIFHEMIEEVIRCIIEGDWVYLWGPSGCGKSYLMKQACDLIGIDMIDNGKITDKYSIMAYNDPHGNFRATPTFIAVYYGKMLKLDEFDNGNPDTQVVLNEVYSALLDVLENPSKPRYITFAEDMTVPVHPNFRMISGGNTSGEGENAIFSSRGKIDESVQERQTPKRTNYDNRVEYRIFGDNESWYQLFTNFRSICDAYAKREGLDTPPGIVTTRDAFAITKYIKHNSKSIDQVIREKFVQTKSDSYLKFIIKQAQEIYGLSEVTESDLVEYEYLSDVPGEELGKRLIYACDSAIKNGRK